MPERAINLAFYCYPRKGAVDDFREVARRIERAAPDIRAHVFRTDLSVGWATGWLRLASRPTAYVEMDRIKWFRPLRGRRLGHARNGGIGGKLWEYPILDAAGCPLPRWTEITPTTKLDPAEWGPYVVVKPSRGGRGAYVWVNKTGRVKYKPPESFPEGHPGRRGPMLAQRFIYTGRWPTSYRVVTYFGRPILSIRYDGVREGAPLEGPDRFRDSGGRSIVASAKGSHIELSAEPDVLALATRTHLDAFPDIPSLGHDIIREAGSGKLYLAEVNPGGESWMLTNGDGRKMQAQFNIDFYKQFGALDVIAETSIEVARRAAI